MKIIALIIVLLGIWCFGGYLVYHHRPELFDKIKNPKVRRIVMGPIAATAEFVEYLKGVSNGGR